MMRGRQDFHARPERGAGHWRGMTASDPFPTATFGDLPYVHYAAEDAGGAIWTARHGLPLSLERVGAPVVRDGWLDCAAGCYEVEREPWPAEIDFSVWLLAYPRPNQGARMLYNGEATYSNNPISMAFDTYAASIYAGSIRKTYDAPADTKPHSYTWSRAFSGLGYISETVTVLVDGLMVVPTNTLDRTLNASGTVFTVGGYRKTTGETQLTGGLIRDVLLTVGWTLTPTHRAALETYRERRTT